MKIRKATVDDVKDVSRIHALSWKAAYQGIVPQSYLDELKEDFWVPIFEKGFNDHVITALVVLENGRLIGCITYGKARDEALAGWGEILSMYLLPEYYGQGYGHKLLERALLDLEQSGFQNLYLWVLKENRQARNFYEKHNWRCDADAEDSFEIAGKQLATIRYVFSFDHSR